MTDFRVIQELLKYYEYHIKKDGFIDNTEATIVYLAYLKIEKPIPDWLKLHFRKFRINA